MAWCLMMTRRTYSEIPSADFASLKVETLNTTYKHFTLNSFSSGATLLFLFSFTFITFSVPFSHRAFRCLCAFSLAFPGRHGTPFSRRHGSALGSKVANTFSTGHAIPFSGRLGIPFSRRLGIPFSGRFGISFSGRFGTNFSGETGRRALADGWTLADTWRETLTWGQREAGSVTF